MDNMTLRNLWRQVVASPSVYLAFFYGLSGLGFVGANLVLANVLPTQEFGLLTLMLSILSVAVSVAPIGLDGLVNRQGLEPSIGLLRISLLTSATVGLTAGAIARILYGLDFLYVGLIFAAVLSGGVALVAAAVFQRRQQFVRSLAISQVLNLTLVLSAAGAYLLGFDTSLFPVVFVTLGSFVISVVIWQRLLRQTLPGTAGVESHQLKEALYYAAVSSAGILMLHLERLLIPITLSLEDLATFGVVASLVLAPFRMLQMGAGIAMLPRLRAAASITDRRRIVKRETIVVGGVALLGSVLVYVLVPVVAEIFLKDKYPVSRGLVIAALVAGVLRVAGGFLRGVTAALCNTRELGMLSGALWISVVVTCWGVMIGSRWGLTGAVLGATGGWLLRAVVSFYLARPHFRLVDVGDGASQ